MVSHLPSSIILLPHHIVPTITAAEDYSTRKYPTLLLVYFAHFAFDHGSAAVPFFAFTSSILFSLGLVCFRDWLGPQMWDQSLPNWHRNARPQAHVGPAHPVQEGAGATFSGEDGPRRDRDHLGGWRVGPGRYDFEGVLLQVFLCLNLFSSGLLEVSSFRRGACLSPLRGTLHQVHFFAGLFDPLFSTHLNKLELIFVFPCHALRSTPPPHACASSLKELSRSMIKLRTDGVNSASYADLFPPCKPGSLLEGTAPDSLQAVWRAGQEKLASS